MKKFFTQIFLIIAIIFSQCIGTFALSVEPFTRTNPKIDLNNIVFPEGKDFKILKQIIETKFENRDNGQRYACIENIDYCANIFYTESDVYILKAIVERNFDNHKDFFTQFFVAYDWNDEISEKQKVMQSIPITLGNHSIKRSLVTDIFSRSFYSVENFGHSTILKTLENKVNEMAGNKCFETFENWQDGEGCYEEKNYKNFYPTPEEFWAESIYNGRNEFPIKNFADIIDYSLSDGVFELKYKKENYTIEEAENYILQKLGDKLHFTKKDYSPLIQGKNIPNIPHILQNLPNDVLIIYVKNPENFFAMLEPSKNLVATEFGINIGPKVKDFLEKFFHKNIDEVGKSLNEEFVILVENSDFIKPSFSVILSENNAKNFDKNFKNFYNYKFFANNSDFEAKIFATQENNFLKNSSDFLYAWEKKAKKVNDIFVFSGDNFFANLIEFQNFMTTQKNFLEYKTLLDLQKLSHTYEKIEGKLPENIQALQSVNFNALEENIFKNYEIIDGKIVKKATEKTYTQDEINSYIFMREGYSDIWNTTLDPMGMTINTKNEGIEIDFFMTPAPSFVGTQLEIFEEIFKNATKSKLSILTNETKNLGFLTIFFGADIEKIEQKFSKETTEIREGLQIQEKISEILTGEMAVIFSDMNTKNPGISLIIGKNPKFGIENLKHSPIFEELKILDNTTNKVGNSPKIYTTEMPLARYNLYISENQNFFIFSLSESKIKELINLKNPQFTAISELENGTFFAINFIENLLRKNVENIFENYIPEKNNGDFYDDEIEMIKSFAKWMIMEEIHNFVETKNQNPNAKFEKKFGNITIFEENYNFFVTDGSATEALITDAFNIKISEEMLVKIIKNAISDHKKIIDDFLFSLHFGDDEIGFKLRISDENFADNTFSDSKKQNFWLGMILSILAVILSGFALWHQKKYSAKNTGA